VIKWDGWGSTPRKSDNRVEGEAEMPEKWDYENKKLEFEVNMKIHYDKIMEYKHWRQNKAIF